MATLDFTIDQSRELTSIAFVILSGSKLTKIGQLYGWLEPQHRCCAQIGS